MPGYLVTATYTSEGIKGVVKNGGTARADAVRSATKIVVLLSPAEIDAAAKLQVSYTAPGK